MGQAKLAAALLRGKGTSADQANLDKLLTLLEKSPAGWADVQAAAATGVTIQFDMSDGGALFRRHGNLIILNRMRVPRSLATSFCHEATHCRFFHEGRGAEAQTQSKEDNAETIVREETETYLREAIVGRELLHVERRASVPDWHQSLNEHSLQMWFALVHKATYGKRPGDAMLDADAALTTRRVAELELAVRPYFRKYVEPYRVVQYIKWDIVRGHRPPLDSDTLRGVLDASFDKQPRAERQPFMGPAPLPPMAGPAPASRSRRSARGDGFG